MKKERVKQKCDAFLLFVLVVLIMIFGLVFLEQIRDARFDARLSSIEGSVTRIEGGVEKLVGVIQRYERALDFPGQEDEDVQVGLGDRKVTK